MSTSRTVRYACPYCGKDFEADIYDMINVEEDPDLRDRCVSGDLFRVSCPHCKKDFMNQFPLVYIDKPNRFVLWLSKEAPNSSLLQISKPLSEIGYTLRRCPTLQEFVEKIEILEDGVNDVLVELAKYDCFIEFIDNEKGVPEDVTSIEYQHTNNGVMKINVRADDKGMSFHVPIDMVEEEMEQNPELYEVDNEHFPVINGDWIISLFQETDGYA
ncbi:MAG: CpXC domain-containing protein [Solobacterium sp.]|nr:CpXC domain-containing protein [Solobacterium sp.]